MNSWELCKFVGNDVRFPYTYALCNDQVRVINISITSNIYPFFVVRIFKILFFAFFLPCPLPFWDKILCILDWPWIWYIPKWAWTFDPHVFTSWKGGVMAVPLCFVRAGNQTQDFIRFEKILFQLSYILSSNCIVFLIKNFSCNMFWPCFPLPQILQGPPHLPT